ncbi:MAG: hypothetical protein U1G05_03405 [Kiritimatiellia bacterium]
MKPFILVCALALPFSVPAAGIQITAREKTLEVDKGKKVDLPHGDVRRRDKEVVVAMTIRNMQPANKGKFTVQWSLHREDAFGKVSEVQQKQTVVELPVGREVAVESDVVTISDVRWDAKRNRDNASLSQDLYGYGVRVLDDQGRVAGEFYKPAAVQGRIKWAEPSVEAKPERGKREKQSPRRPRPPPSR